MNFDDEVDGDELVERLILLTAEDDVVPVGGAARAKAALRPAWSAAVRRRTARRRAAWSLGGLAAAALLLLVFGLWRGAADPPPVAGRIDLVRGTVTVERPGQTLATSAGATVRRGETVRTGRGDRARIRLETGAVVRIDAATSLRVDSEHGLSLDSGGIYVETDGTDALDVTTRRGTVRHVGTRFEVRHEAGSTRVRVRDGSVFVLAGGDAVRLGAHHELTAGPDGSVRTRTIPPHGASWDWILDVSAPFTIEGKTAAALLEWVERETGRSVRFADAGAESIARRAILHGTVPGLRADEAAEMILPSAGLEVEEEEGVLRVRSIQ